MKHRGHFHSLYALTKYGLLSESTLSIYLKLKLKNILVLDMVVYDFQFIWIKNKSFNRNTQLVPIGIPYRLSVEHLLYFKWCKCQIVRTAFGENST